MARETFIAHTSAFQTSLRETFEGLSTGKLKEIMRVAEEFIDDAHANMAQVQDCATWEDCFHTSQAEVRIAKEVLNQREKHAEPGQPELVINT